MLPQIEAVSATGGVRVRFAKEGDRFSHTVERLDEQLDGQLDRDRPVTLLRSHDAWPVFQELHRQDDPAAGPVLFLTGMSDKRYWSACVTRRDDDGEPVIAWDLACRSSLDCRALGVRYSVAEGLQASLVEGGAVALAMGGRKLGELRPSSLGEQPPCGLALEDAAIVITPAVASEATPIEQTRWAFEFAASTDKSA
jgi:hypothetical protein